MGRINMVCQVWRMEIVCGKDEWCVEDGECGKDEYGVGRMEIVCGEDAYGVWRECGGWR